MQGTFDGRYLTSYRCLEMSTQGNKQSLRECLYSLGARRNEDLGLKWAVGSRWFETIRFGSTWPQRQETILEELFHATNLPWFLTAEDLATDDDWIVIDQLTRRIPKNLCAWAFLNTPPIPEGNWLLYAAPEPKTMREIPDPFRTSGSNFRAWLDEHKISILVASWPDDVDWALHISSEIITHT